MSNPNESTLVGDIARIIAGNTERVQGKFKNGGDVNPFIIIPEGHFLQTLSPATESPLPSYITASPTFHDAGSFAAYVSGFKGASTRIFLDAINASFHSVLDYHAPGKVERCSHRALFKLQLSPEWKFWSGLHDVWLTQEQVVEILEDHRADIVSPSAADLVKLASDLKATESAEFVQKTTRTGSGAAVVLTTKVESGSGESITPEAEMVISIPVFKNGTKLALDVALTWRGKPQQFVKFRVLEMQQKLDAAIANERELVAAAAGVPVLLGTV
jgi:hypothetical protein